MNNRVEEIKTLYELRPGAIYHVKVGGLNKYPASATRKHYLYEWLKQNVPECKFIVTSDNVDIGSTDMIDKKEVKTAISKIKSDIIGKYYNDYKELIPYTDIEEMEKRIIEVLKL